MSPKIKALLLGGVALAGLFRGLEALDHYVASYDVYQPKLNSRTDESLSPQGFYPVLVEARRGGAALPSLDGINLNQAFGASANESALDAPRFLSVQGEDESAPAADEAAEVREVSPINFLQQHKVLFRVQALLPHQQGAIINGQAYAVGERLNQKLEARFSDHQGNHHFEMITPVVSRVTENEITLRGQHSRGWDQHAVLRIEG